MIRYAILLLSLLALSACTTAPDPNPDDKIKETPKEPENKPPEALDGHARLSADIVAPTGYTLTLSVDPTKDRFSGQVVIDIDIKQPTWFIQLHAGDLTIKSAQVESGERHDAKVRQDKNGGLILESPVKLATGIGVIYLDFEGGLDEVPESLYRVKEGDAWYVYTQFEPLEAREAFPCFDDPGFKTTFSTTLKVPKGFMAMSNTPEAERKDEGEWTSITFAETKPLPTYLVAMAIGDFDVVEAPADAIKGVPLRLITTKGKGSLANYALEKTPIILEALTNYFGSPYPYAKLDLVAVPNFSAGAMENVGLVTFRETLLLFKPESAPIRTRYASQSVIAHELAHMWFGNLVTMAWWDDLWLNEAFATWMATRVVAEVAPELEAPLDGVSSARRVMSTDARSAARAVRQPIAHGGDVYNAFDGITYTKGAAVLRMIESWTGAEDFKRGVRDYLGANAFGVATTEDLLKALELSTGKPVAKVLGRFIDQPGTPWVNTEVVCGEGKAEVKLSQSRYLPAGSKASQGEPWQVPVCMKYEVGGEEKRTCALLDAPEKTIALEGCPTWLHPNAEAKGYYRWKLPTDATLALVKTHRGSLSMAERVGLTSHLNAMLEAEALPADVWLEAIGALGAENHRLIVRDVIGGLQLIDRYGVEDAQRKAFQTYVRKMLAGHLKRVGTTPKKGESAEVAMLRPSLIGAMASMGADKKLIAKAKANTKKFLKNNESVAPDEASLSLRITARTGNKKLWEALKAELAEVKTPLARRAILGGLGNFRDPVLLEKSFELLLDGTLHSQDYWSIIGPAFSTEETHAVMWAWVTKNYDRILKGLGDKRARSIPWAAGGFCTEEGRKTAADFFAQPGKSIPGTERNLSMALEGVERCARRKAIVKPGVKDFFSKKR